MDPPGVGSGWVGGCSSPVSELCFRAELRDALGSVLELCGCWDTQGLLGELKWFSSSALELSR